MPESASIPSEQFDDLRQQDEASNAGMWTFLATEIIFFGGLFLAYIVYRYVYPHAFAVGGSHMAILSGTANTAILLTSSLSMALAVQGAQTTGKKGLLPLLGLTLALGGVFIVIKGFEYHEHFSNHLFPGAGFRSDLPRETQLFFWLYFVMTGLHALHVLIGMGLMSWLALRLLVGKFSHSLQSAIEIVGLYWHFVDIVWVFLYPLFYLIHR